MTTTTTSKLTAIATYLERQTDLAFLDYRRATKTGGEVAGMSTYWHDDRFTSREDLLYSRWIEIGNAYYLIRDLLTTEQSRLNLWRDLLHSFIDRSRHDSQHIPSDTETSLDNQGNV